MVNPSVGIAIAKASNIKLIPYKTWFRLQIALTTYDEGVTS